MASINPQDLERLRALAQEVDPPTRFEQLVASLMGELLGTSIAVAKSGFQNGGDADVPPLSVAGLFRVQVSS